MARKKDNTLVMLVAVGLAIFLVSQGYIDLSGGPTLAVDGVPTTTTGTGGVQVNVGTPTLEWYAQDAMIGSTVALAADAYRVTINGTSADKTAAATLDAARGDSYKICVRPNATYYGNCISGTISKVVTKVTVPLTKIGTATIWINNDPENATVRNATALAGRDTLAASDTDTATVCVQGASTNASYGDGAILIIIDYNSLQLATAPTLSIGTPADGKIPQTMTHDDSNQTNARVAYEYIGSLTNQETVCGTLVIENNSSTAASWLQNYPLINVHDRFSFHNSVTDAIESGYAIATSGGDTNSATNATAVNYYII